MKNRIFTLIFAIVLLFGMSVTAVAANPELVLESSYNAETGLVTVSIYIKNAVGLQSADLSLGFAPEMYEFNDYTTSDIDGMIAAGYIENKPGLCTCSVIFTEKCLESDLDNDGKLYLATYTFKPVDDKYDINEFCLWASSFDVNDVGVLKTVNVVGNTKLQENKTDSVTLKTTQKIDDAQEKTTKKGADLTSAEINSRWYVYLIAGVLAVGAIAGIAFVAIKSSHNENSEKSEDSESNEKQE